METELDSDKATGISSNGSDFASTPVLTANPLDSVQTMTAYMVQTSLGEAPHGTIEFKTMFAVGLVLFVLTLAMNIFGHWIVKRWRETY